MNEQGSAAAGMERPQRLHAARSGAIGAAAGALLSK
jgi:hypothetical protein